MSMSLLNRSRVRGDFFLRYAQVAAGLRLDRMAMMTQSDAASERYGFVGGPSAPRKRTGPKTVPGVVGQKIDVVNEPWYQGFSVDRLDAKRDQTGSFQRRSQQLGAAFAEFKLKLLTDLLQNAALKSYDGQTFFDTDHEVEASGAQKNLLTSAEVTELNVADAQNPTPEEAAVFLAALASYTLRYKGAGGEPMHGIPTQFLAMVPANMGRGVNVAVSANSLGLAANTILGLRDSGRMVIDAIVNPRLTIGADLYLFVLDGAAPAFIIQEEEPTWFQYWDEESDHYKDMDEFKVVANWTGGSAGGEPLSVIKATLS